jgi:hypothetical protein
MSAKKLSGAPLNHFPESDVLDWLRPAVLIYANEVYH